MNRAPFRKADLHNLPLQEARRDNCIGVGALSRHRRWRGLGAFVCDGIARETVEGRGAVSGSLAGMFPARRRASKLVGKRWQFSKLSRSSVCMRPLPARLPACRRRPAPAVERAVRRVVCRRCGARKPPTFVNFSSRAGELASGCTRVKHGPRPPYSHRSESTPAR